MIVDLFAGGGGASTGIEWRLGRSPLAAAVVRANTVGRPAKLEGRGVGFSPARFARQGALFA